MEKQIFAGAARPGLYRRYAWTGLRTMALTIVAASLLIGAAAESVYAQSYPNKPIRFILPFPPGGPTDILGRVIAQRMAENLGQPLVPENKPGAGGNIGMEVASHAPNDGYCIVLTSPTYAISPTLYKKMNYDPVKDFTPISLVAEIPMVLLVRPGLPIKSLKELVEYARANPGKLKFGSGGIGTTNHLASEYLKATEKLDMLHVPYKGSNQAMLAMISNEVDMVIIGISSAQAHMQSGKVRPIALLSSGQRMAEFPDVPTTKEAGMDNFDFNIWYALLAPAGTPKEIVNRLNAEWVKAAAKPDLKALMKKAGFEPLSSTPEEFAKFGRAETIRYGKAIRENNLSVD